MPASNSPQPPQWTLHALTQVAFHAEVQQEGWILHTQTSHLQPMHPGLGLLWQPLQAPQSWGHIIQSSPVSHFLLPQVGGIPMSMGGGVPVSVGGGVPVSVGGGVPVSVGGGVPVSVGGGVPVSVGGGVPVSVGGGRPKSAKPHPPHWFLQALTQVAFQAVVQHEGWSLHTQVSQLQPMHPGPGFAWQPLQAPQSWGQIMQSSPVSQVLLPQVGMLASVGGGVPVSVGGGVPVSVGGGVPKSAKPHPPHWFLQALTQVAFQAVVQHEGWSLHTQVSQLQPMHPGPGFAWQPLQAPQSWGQIMQSSPVSQVLLPQTGAPLSVGGGVPVSVGGGVPVSEGGGVPASAKPHPPQRSLQALAQVASQVVVQQEGNIPQTQVSHLQPMHPGLGLAWQPLQTPQSWGHIMQSSPVSQVLLPQTGVPASVGGGVPVSVGGGVPVSEGGGKPESTKPQPPHWFLHELTQVAFQAVVQHEGWSLHTQVSQLQPMHPGPGFAWQPLQAPQSWGQIMQSSPVSQVLLPQTGAPVSVGGGVPVSVGGGVPVSVGGGVPASARPQPPH